MIAAISHPRLLQVEPVKWSQQKSRDVLNEAIEGNISDDLLAAASDAVKDGYEGSLARYFSRSHTQLYVRHNECRVPF